MNYIQAIATNFTHLTLFQCFEDIRNQGLFLANYMYDCFPVVDQNIDKHSILPLAEEH
jgi:hypothetical protein